MPVPYAIHRVPRHAHGKLAHLMRPVPTAVHQPAAHNITVVRAVHRLQHVQSAYRVNQDIINLAAVARPVRVSVRQIYHNRVHAIQPARN